MLRFTIPYLPIVGRSKFDKTIISVENTEKHNLVFNFSLRIISKIVCPFETTIVFMYKSDTENNLLFEIKVKLFYYIYIWNELS